MPNYNARRIKARRSYNITEIASRLGVSRKTCGRWIKYKHLKVIEDNTAPQLVMGFDLQYFLKRKRAKKGIVLKEKEFFCVKCREAVIAKVGSEETITTGKRNGRNNQEQFKRTGLCNICGTKVNRFLKVG